MTDETRLQIPLNAPYSQEAEEAVIGSVLVNPNAYVALAAFLETDDFYLLRHQFIWQAIARLMERKEVADYLTIITELKNMGWLEDVGGPAYLTRLINNTPNAIHAEFYGRIVERAAVRRRLLKAADEIKALAVDEQLDLDRVVNESETRLFNVTDRQVKREFKPIYEAVNQYFDQIEYLMQNRDQSFGVPSGFKDLDTLLGGFQRSDLVIFAGRPGMGKTSFLLSAAANAARMGGRVAIFSMEMGADQIVQRLISMETGISSQKLRLAQLTPQEYMRFVEAAGRVSNMHMFIDDTPALSPLQMRTKCRRLEHEHGLDMIMVDYLQLMNAGGQYQNNRVQEISYISRALKELARELNVPLLSAAQLSRAVEQRQDKRPVLSDLRESGCIAGDELVYLPDEGRHVSIRSLNGQSGFRVLSLNERTWKLEPALVTHAFCTGTKPVYRMTTRSGRTIRATGNHKFLTICGWKRLDELTTDDHIATPRTLPTPSVQTMTNAELALLGHLIGDGCTLPQHAVQYTTRELDLAETVARLAVEVFGETIIPRIQMEKGHTWYQVFLSAAQKLTHGKYNPVRVWLESLGVWGLRSYEKFVPEKVFQQPREAIALFLRHLWATDGSITITQKNTGPYPMVYFASSSRRLASDIQSLLLRFEITAILKRIPQGTKGMDQYHVIVTGRPDLDYFADHIGAVGAYRLSKLGELRDYIQIREGKSNRDIIPMQLWDIYVTPLLQLEKRGVVKPRSKQITRTRALRIAEETGSATIHALATSDVYWDEIVSIEPDGESDVYDLTVEAHHNFSCCNIICHNSIEQDADVVMFLYRDVVYNEATEYPNQADVIVGKHRNGPTGTVQLFYDGKLTKFMDGAVRRIDLGDV